MVASARRTGNRGHVAPVASCRAGVRPEGSAELQPERKHDHTTVMTVLGQILRRCDGRSLPRYAPFEGSSQKAMVETPIPGGWAGRVKRLIDEQGQHPPVVADQGSGDVFARGV